MIQNEDHLLQFKHVKHQFLNLKNKLCKQISHLIIIEMIVKAKEFIKLLLLEDCIKISY